MRKYLFFIALISMGVTYAQNPDFESTGFEIKAIAMAEATHLPITIDLKSNDLPSRMTLGPVFRKRGTTAGLPLMYKQEARFTAKNIPDPTITIAPIKAEIYAFNNNGGVSEIKNIAYKPAVGGPFYSNYCPVRGGFY